MIGRAEPGQALLAQNAYGEWIPKRAVSGVEREGHSFPVVWVCAPEDWQNAATRRSAVPWPAEYVIAVRVAHDHPTVEAILGATDPAATEKAEGTP